MTTTTKTEAKAVPTRDGIDDKHKWNLIDLFPSDDSWEEGVKQAEGLISKAKEFIGKLSSSPQVLYECFETRNELNIITAKLYQYAKLNQELDNRVSKYQAMTERAASLSSRAGAAFAFVEPELLKIDETTLMDMEKQFPKTGVYDFYLKELIRSSKHIRSEEVEELLAMSATVARGPESIFTMLDDADLVYPSIKDEKGNEVKLTKQRYARFLESSDARVRKDAHYGFYSAYKKHVNTLGASLGAAITKDVFYTKARRFDNCLVGSLFGDNIPEPVYHSLLDTTESNLAGINKYTSVRKRILNLDEIHTYDMMCPLFPDRDYEISYDNAVKEILEALQPLGDDYIKVLSRAFDSRWVDVFETQGKGSGAFSWGSFTAHPFVLMNYNNTVDNMFTLAHEMGHALHSHLSCSTQPYAKSQYSIFVAEVASTLNEGLLLLHLLKKADDDRDRLYLLNRYIDNTWGTFFNQVMYGRFELKIHQEVENGGALSPDFMNDLWKELSIKYYGPDLSMDEYSPFKWSRIPHFYMNFYVYQYATSYAASQAILDKVTAGEEGIIGKYLELLSSGGKDYPIELLKTCGVDMSTPAPVDSTLKRFAEQVDELDKLG
ncbi:MAG: oligoendopeptidase F [Candidatus Zixiibacteriota bacterium]|nr:MAG: oligoendopeptidase F [candidate division Zixibacteria bacterium]